MQSSQDTFTKMILDLTPARINTGQGYFVYGKNGKIINNGQNNFKWVSDTGTEKTFTLPLLPHRDVTVNNPKINLYYFDGRSIGYENIADSIRESIIDFYVANVLVGSLFIRVEYIVSTNKFNVTISIKNFGTFSNVVTYTAVDLTSGLYSGWSIEHYVLYRVGIVMNTIPLLDRNSISFTLLKHDLLDSQANYVPELENTDTKYNDFTWYMAFSRVGTALFNINCRKTETSDTAYPGITLVDVNRSLNIYGWGRGSQNGSSSSFPASAPFPTPGMNNSDAFANEMPQGCPNEYKQDVYYYIKAGRGYKTKVSTQNPVTQINSSGFEEATYSDLLTGPAFFKLDTATNESFTKDTEQTDIVEVNPITYFYQIVQNQYSELPYHPALPLEFIESVKVTNNKIVAFFIGGDNLYKVIYLLDFSEATVKVTELLKTTEDIDFSLTNPITNCYSRFESAEYAFVYWCCKKGHLRTLNINNPITKNADFETRLFKPVTFGKIQVSNVYRSGGTLLVGSYLFCYELSIDGVNWTRASSHTNPVMIGSADGYNEEIDETDVVTNRPTPIPEPYSKYKGFAPGTRTTHSIEVRVTNIDRRYKYIKVYSIEAINGAGSYGSTIVNVIHQGELRNSDYHEFNTVYSGINNILSGGINISEVTKPTIVPVNINSFHFSNNRLIIAGYDEYTKSLTDDEKYQMTAIAGYGITESVGTEQTNAKRDIDGEFNILGQQQGYKHFKQQQWKKTLANKRYDFAWVFEDEYGNNTEPINAFYWDGQAVNQPFFNLVNHVGSNRYFLIGSNKMFDAAYQFNTQGIALSLGVNAIPTWAKKAKLVRRVNDFSKMDVHYVCVHYDHLRDVFTMYYEPDLTGYDSFKKGGVSVGDRINLTYRADVMSLAHTRSYAENFHPTAPTYDLEGTCVFFPQIGDNAFNADIKTIPVSIESEIKEIISIGDENPPSSTSIKAFRFEFKIKKSLSLAKDYVFFAHVTKEHNGQKEKNIVYYEETGCEFDNVSKRTNKRRNFMPGDSFMGGVIRSLQQSKTFAWNTFTHVYFPAISQMNYAMGTKGWYIGRHEEDYDLSMLISNRDYAVANSFNRHIYISDEYLKEKVEFKNTLLYTDAREANTKFNPYATIKANNIVDLSSEFGEIKAVSTYNGIIYVLFERGIRRLYPNEKEFITTSTGTRIAVGDGSYLMGKDDDETTVKGTQYPILTTDRGIYFYDYFTSSLNRIAKGVEDISFNEQAKSFFSKLISPDTNKVLHKGVFMNFSSIDERVAITLSTKHEEDTTIKITSTTTAEIVIVKNRFNIGDKLQITYDNNKILHVEIDSYFMDGQIKKALVQFNSLGLFGASSPGTINSTYICKISKVKFDVDTIVFNEKINSFEQFTDKMFYRTHTLDNANYGMEFNTNTFFKTETSDDTNVILFNSEETEINFNKTYDQDYFLLNSKTNIVFTKEIIPPFTGQIKKVKVIGDNSATSALHELFRTNKTFLFLKGYTYTIKGVSVYEYYGTNGLIKIDFPEIFAGLYTQVQQQKGHLKSTETTDVYDFIFTVNETFEAPICLFIENLGLHLLQFSFEITEFHKKCNILPELHVVLNEGRADDRAPNMNSEMIVYDNGNISVENIGSELTVEIKSGEQLDSAVTSETDVKIRLNEFRFSIPYVITNVGKERVRGTYHTIMYKFNNYFKKFYVSSVKHLYRKSQ